MAETEIPMSSVSQGNCCMANKSSDFHIALSKITGIAIKKENSAALVLRKPSNKAIVIVIPEREVPGINAVACARPIINTNSQVKSSSPLSRCWVLSAKASSNAPINVVAAITRAERRFSSIKSPSINPTAQPGLSPEPTSRPGDLTQSNYHQGIACLRQPESLLSGGSTR